MRLSNNLVCFEEMFHRSTSLIDALWTS